MQAYDCRRAGETLSEPYGAAPQPGRRALALLETSRREPKQSTEVQQRHDAFQAMREENHQLVERLERLEARQPQRLPTVVSVP